MIETEVASFAEFVRVTAPAALLMVSFVAIRDAPTLWVMGPVPVDVMETGPALIAPSTRSASESSTCTLPSVLPLTLDAMNVPSLLPPFVSVMSLPPVLVTSSESATTAPIWVMTSPAVTFTVLPVTAVNARESSSFSVIFEPAAVAVAAT